MSATGKEEGALGGRDAQAKSFQISRCLPAKGWEWGEWPSRLWGERVESIGGLRGKWGRGCVGWQQVMWPRVFHESLFSFGASGLGEGPGQADWHREGMTARGEVTGNSTVARALEPPHSAHHL